MKRIRATALMIKDDKVLVMHRHKNGEEYFVLPGGSVEEAETPEQGVVRELREETSLIGTIKEKVFSFTDEHETEHQVFLIEYVEGEPKLEADSVETKATTEENIFKPEWIEKSTIANVVFYPAKVKDLLLSYQGAW